MASKMAGKSGDKAWEMSARKFDRMSTGFRSSFQRLPWENCSSLWSLLIWEDSARNGGGGDGYLGTLSINCTLCPILHPWFAPPGNVSYTVPSKQPLRSSRRYLEIGPYQAAWTVEVAVCVVYWSECWKSDERRSCNYLGRNLGIVQEHQTQKSCCQRLRGAGI